MKKLFLSALLGTFVLSTDAQQNNNVILHNDALSAIKVENSARLIPIQKPQPKAHQNSGNKNTNINSAWLNFFRQIATSNYGYYARNTYQDGTLYDTVATDIFAPSPIFFWGFGVSFDPTDSAFNYAFNSADNPFGTPINFAVTNNDAYEVDSIYLDGRYIRNNNYTDSLILDLVVATNPGEYLGPVSGSVTYASDSGTYLIQAPAGYNYSITDDGAPRFANATYDGPNNEISNSIGATKQRYAIPLDLATSVDTDANGSSTFLYVMSPALQVPAGGKVIAYAHFKSGYTYPANTLLDNANYFQFLIGDPSVGVFPHQSTRNATTGYPGSFEEGLMGDEYAAYEQPFWLPNARILVPNCQWSGAYGYDAPDFGFFIKCNTCSPLSVPTVKNIITSNAYPNPANTELYIPFTLSTSADVTITLINALGQVVKSLDIYNVKTGKASFNTGDLEQGIYFYTINGGGQKASGRVVVEH